MSSGLFEKGCFSVELFELMEMVVGQCHVEFAQGLAAGMRAGDLRQAIFVHAHRDSHRCSSRLASTASCMRRWWTTPQQCGRPRANTSTIAPKNAQVDVAIGAGIVRVKISAGHDQPRHDRRQDQQQNIHRPELLVENPRCAARGRCEYAGRACVGVWPVR